MSLSKCKGPKFLTFNIVKEKSERQQTTQIFQYFTHINNRIFWGQSSGRSDSAFALQELI